MSSQVASMILDHYQRSGAAGRDLLLWNNCGTDDYLYPGLVGKSFFHALFLQIFLYGKRFCYRLNL
ncbi:hypothetical protein ACTK7I_004435, partial [Shigella flexneri]